MTNYVWMAHVCLSQMLELREDSERTWNMMREWSFCVANSEVPFTSIGTDHEIEEENWALKVLLGIKGMAKSSQNPVSSQND